MDVELLAWVTERMKVPFLRGESVSRDAKEPVFGCADVDLSGEHPWRNAQ